MDSQQQDSSPRWQFWIDRGGTFTDFVAQHPDGRLGTLKLLSENPAQYENAAVEGMRRLLELSPGEPIPPHRIAAVKMGTTVATNALLERKGEACVLAITQGFGDALRIAYQNRPDIFALHIRLPTLLYSHVVEVNERVSAQGDVLQALDRETARRDLQAAYDLGFRSIAIVLMHGYRHPQHEQQLAALAQAIGFRQISVSHQISPLMKLVSRGDTTVADAYLSPVLHRHIALLSESLGGAGLSFMQSNGGLVAASQFQGKDSVLSGPAGGVVAVAKTAARAGFAKVIGFDMGGTSTDVCHYAGEYERGLNTVVAGVRLSVPMMQIHTVAAGGGSILSFDGARLRVGPDSAGANPGPACYRNGGPLTVTDCNLLLGRLQPAFFPAAFGPNADQRLDLDASRRLFAAMAASIRQATGIQRGVFEIAEGFLRIAVENMANAIRKVSVQRGYDVREYVLGCFGSAAGQQACAVADALGMTHILIHPFAGVLSAYGMGLAERRVIRQQAMECLLSAAIMPDLERRFAALLKACRLSLSPEDRQTLQCLNKAYLRYQGTDTALSVDYGSLHDMSAQFDHQHRQLFGFSEPGRALMVESISVEAISASAETAEPSLPPRPDGTPLEPVTTAGLYVQGSMRQTPVYRRDALCAGDRLDGPALIVEPLSTTVLEPGWHLQVGDTGNLALTKQQSQTETRKAGTAADPVLLEIFNNLFMSIAEQMGATLEKTAHSVNIKERLDFSCAVFDGGGNLVANAPHMPVHLGSMGESVRAVIRHGQTNIRRGDAYAVNSPYHGGTHLPDITVVSPVFVAGAALPCFWVASRGHHADVGGISPGSMPPNSQDITQEGVLIEPCLLAKGGTFLEQNMLDRLTQGPYPARQPAQNLADLKAQIAANEKGIQELQKLAARHGADVVTAYMGHVQSHAEHCVRRLLRNLNDGAFACDLDNGCRVCVKLTVNRDAGSASIDFTGTSAQHPGNFNAPSAVCRAAVMYVFRSLVNEDIPLNEGFLRPLNLIIPPGSLLNPKPPAAVVAGNVETSQTITDCLYAALGVLAAAQGTMNNLTFGDNQRQYYETIAGGSGAGAEFDGTDAVQTHMTNSRLTDPEVLEWRFPVLLESFAIRPGSGGAGQHRGGNGVVRRIRFLQAMTAAILSNRRETEPFGLAGGLNGQCGRNRVIRSDGQTEWLGGQAEATVQAGDAILIETPGGGGYGKL